MIGVFLFALVVGVLGQTNPNVVLICSIDMNNVSFSSDARLQTCDVGFPVGGSGASTRTACVQGVWSTINVPTFGGIFTALISFGEGPACFAVQDPGWCVPTASNQFKCTASSCLEYPWTEWSSCSACSNGKRTRYRAVVAHTTSDGGPRWVNQPHVGLVDISEVCAVGTVSEPCGDPTTCEAEAAGSTFRTGMIVLAVVMGGVFVVPVFILTYRRYLLRCGGRRAPRNPAHHHHSPSVELPPVAGQLPIADEVVHDHQSSQGTVAPARLVRLPPSMSVSDLLTRLGLTVQPSPHVGTHRVPQDPQLAALSLPSRRLQPVSSARDTYPSTAV